MPNSKQDEIIHVGIPYSDSISSKRSLLQSQESFLKTIQIIKSYSKIRKKETLIKSRLKKAFTDLGEEIKELEEILPESSEIKIPSKRRRRIEHSFHPMTLSPEKLREEQENQLHKQELQESRKKKNQEIEDELQAIKQQLDSLE